MDQELLVGRVQRWSGMRRQKDAERAIFATLKALRDAMFDDEADALAAQLPRHFVRSMRGGAPRAPDDLKALYERAARYEGVPVRVALEHVQAVCQALGSLLPETASTRISQALPDLADLFVAPERESHPATVLSAHAPTLAEGRPGSAHPLSEGLAPRANAPTGSRRTLSEGRPGFEHPLSEAGPRIADRSPLRTRK